MMPRMSPLRWRGPMRSTSAFRADSLHVGGADTPRLQPPVEPGNEEDVSQSGLDGLDVRRAREERIGQHVPQAPEPHLVERALLVEQIQHTPHLVPVTRCEIDPRQRWRHFSPVTRVAHLAWPFVRRSGRSRPTRPPAGREPSLDASRRGCPAHHPQNVAPLRMAGDPHFAHRCRVVAGAGRGRTISPSSPCGGFSRPRRELSAAKSTTDS